MPTIFRIMDTEQWIIGHEWSSASLVWQQSTWKQESKKSAFPEVLCKVWSGHTGFQLAIHPPGYQISSHYLVRFIESENNHRPGIGLCQWNTSCSLLTEGEACLFFCIAFGSECRATICSASLIFWFLLRVCPFVFSSCVISAPSRKRS